MRHRSCLAHFPSLFSTVWPEAVRPQARGSCSALCSMIILGVQKGVWARLRFRECSFCTVTVPPTDGHVQSLGVQDLLLLSSLCEHWETLSSQAKKDRMRKPVLSQRLDAVPPGDLQGEPSCLRRAWYLCIIRRIYLCLLSWSIHSSPECPSSLSRLQGLEPFTHLAGERLWAA